jgi:hypothetical protein
MARNRSATTPVGTLPASPSRRPACPARAPSSRTVRYAACGSSVRLMAVYMTRTMESGN